MKKNFNKNLTVLIGALSIVIFTFLESKVFYFYWDNPIMQYSSLSLFIFSTIIISILIQYKIKPIIAYSTITKVNDFIEKEYPLNDLQANENLFNSFFNLFIVMILMYSPNFVLIWVAHYLSTSMLIIISLILMIILIIYEHRREIWLLYFIASPVIGVNLIWGSPTAACVCLCTLLISLIYLKNKKKKKISANHKTAPKGLLKLLAEFHILGKIINNRIFNIRQRHEVQSIVILLMVLVFIIGPKIIKYFPPEISYLESQYNKLTMQFFDYVPYITVLLYASMNIIPISSFFIPHILIKNDNKIYQKVINAFLLVIITLILIMLIYFPALLIGVFMIAIGNAIIGKEFTILVGFFAFPGWISVIYSYLICILLFAFPQKDLGSFINQTNL